MLQCLAGARQGGAEMHFVRLALALKRAGLEQRVVMRPNPEAEALLREGGLEPVTARFGGPLDMTTGRVLRREAAAFRPDIALGYMRRACRWLPQGRKGGDFIRIGRLGGYYDLKDFTRCDHLVGITPDIVEHCRRGGWAEERTHVIPNFVEDVSAPPHPRAALDTPEDAPLVFALGRLHRNKAFDVLLAALAKLPEAYLWLAGEGPLRAVLEAEAERLGVAGRVRFLGWQSDSAPYFAASDLYVVPSRHEPLGSVLLEGWMSRVPMVAAASQGPSWLVEHERNGLLVPIDDAEAMAAALRRLLDEPDLAARLVAQGRADYEAGFTEEAAVKQYLALFEKVLAERRDSSDRPSVEPPSPTLPLEGGREPFGGDG